MDIRKFQRVTVHNGLNCTPGCETSLSKRIQIITLSKIKCVVLSVVPSLRYVISKMDTDVEGIARRTWGSHTNAILAS